MLEKLIALLLTVLSLASCGENAVDSGNTYVWEPKRDANGRFACHGEYGDYSELVSPSAFEKVYERFPEYRDVNDYGKFSELLKSVRDVYVPQLDSGTWMTSGYRIDISYDVMKHSDAVVTDYIYGYWMNAAHIETKRSYKIICGFASPDWTYDESGSYVWLRIDRDVPNPGFHAEQLEKWPNTVYKDVELIETRDDQTLKKIHSGMIKDGGYYHEIMCKFMLGRQTYWLISTVWAKDADHPAVDVEAEVAAVRADLAGIAMAIIDRS